jgi:capsular exopolysaccharide synthesis family protein
VVVVDCDMRRPRVDKFFDLSQDPGFTSVLLGEMPLSLALQPVKDMDGLRVLTSGPTPPNPSELLSGQRTAEIFEALRSECDLVLIDSPPVLPVSDGVVIAGRVDATLVVVNDGETRRKQLTRALELLYHVDAKVIGTVLNRVAKGTIDYGYSYGYYGYKPYAAAEPPKNGNGLRNRRVKVTANAGASLADTPKAEPPVDESQASA